jgi:7-keto-8-aminopelargonate synthetase-like enzyme
MATSRALPLSMCTSPAEGGYTALHATLEASVAAYVGKEAAIVFNMGFATNSLGLPCLGGKGTLLVSDNLNHNSIVTGARASGATVRVYRHDDYRGLESLLRSSIVEGQDRTHRPWRKIVILVEGIYSMEGEMCNLNAVVALAKRYKAYVYLDEAHSIGALGATGRGLCEQKGVNPADVDILMGTFTKSFGAMGGYIAGSRAFVDYVRSASAGFLADNAMSPVVVQQILTALAVMKGEDGTSTGAEKLRRLRDNSNYMRQGLIDLGCEVYGEWDSPVIPVMLYNPTKIAAFSRECLKRGVRARRPRRSGMVARSQQCWLLSMLAAVSQAARDHALSSAGCACPLTSPPPSPPSLAPSPRADRRGGRGLPRDAAHHVARALLHQRRAHARRAGRGARQDRRGVHAAQAALPQVAHGVSASPPRAHARARRRPRDGSGPPWGESLQSSEGVCVVVTHLTCSRGAFLSHVREVPA